MSGYLKHTDKSIQKFDNAAYMWIVGTETGLSSTKNKYNCYRLESGYSLSSPSYGSAACSVRCQKQ